MKYIFRSFSIKSNRKNFQSLKYDSPRYIII